MSYNNPLEQANPLADKLAQKADHAIRSTQSAANGALDSLASSVAEVRQQVAPAINHATEQVNALAHRGMDSVRNTSKQLMDSAHRVSDTTVGYVKEEPVKSILIAAATGAALMALVSLMTRSSR